MWSGRVGSACSFSDTRRVTNLCYLGCIHKVEVEDGGKSCALKG
jgi:hypothetical protein